MAVSWSSRRGKRNDTYPPLLLLPPDETREGLQITFQAVRKLLCLPPIYDRRRNALKKGRGTPEPYLLLCSQPLCIRGLAIALHTHRIELHHTFRQGDQLQNVPKGLQENMQGVSQGWVQTQSSWWSNSKFGGAYLPLKCPVQGCHNDRLPCVGHCLTKVNNVWKLDGGEKRTNESAAFPHYVLSCPTERLCQTGHLPGVLELQSILKQHTEIWTGEYKFLAPPCVTIKLLFASPNTRFVCGDVGLQCVWGEWATLGQGCWTYGQWLYSPSPAVIVPLAPIAVRFLACHQKTPHTFSVNKGMQRTGTLF